MSEQTQPTTNELSSDYKAMLAKFLEGVHAFVEADRCTATFLYEEHTGRGGKIVENTRGMFFVIGELAGWPLTISLTDWVVDGTKIILVEQPSMVGHRQHAIDWLTAHAPETAFLEVMGNKRLRTSDATNWHNVLPRE